MAAAPAPAAPALLPPWLLHLRLRPSLPVQTYLALAVQWLLALPPTVALLQRCGRPCWGVAALPAALLLPLLLLLLLRPRRPPLLGSWRSPWPLHFSPPSPAQPLRMPLLLLMLQLPPLAALQPLQGASSGPWTLQRQLQRVWRGPLPLPLPLRLRLRLRLQQRQRRPLFPPALPPRPWRQPP